MPASHGPRRRAVIAAIPLAAVLAGCTSPPKRAPGATALRFFTSHQAAVVEDATARIAPGPTDDPAEAGHPGAREADVTGYIDTMLGALGALASSPPPVIFAGGPWSNRHTSGPDLMDRFVPLDPVAKIAWRKRLTGWQQQYTKGIAALDKLAGGDFTKATPDHQDKILAMQSVSTFTALLFEHTIEGLYAIPEYGGNRGLAGLEGHRLPRRHPAARLHQRRGRAFRRARSGRRHRGRGRRAQAPRRGVRPWARRW